MHLRNTVSRHLRRSRRLPGLARASAQAALATCVTALVLAHSPLAHACGYHDPAGASVGMLNWAFPDALHVRTAVWMAQDTGLLAPRPPQPAADPLPSTVRLQQMLRLRETQSRLGAVQGRIQASLDGQPMPAFAVVLIGPMLWTRFESTDGSVTMLPHATGPAQADVVLVTDEAVLAALDEGRLTAHEARAEGLVKAYGTRENIVQVSALLDRAFQLKNH